MDNIKKLYFPLEASSLLHHLQIPSYLVVDGEHSIGHYEVDEVYAPKILRNLVDLNFANFPTLSGIYDAKFKLNTLPF
jgi:hypothetical protein